MDKFLNATRRFLRDEEGVTAIEYGLIAALIAVLIIGGATVVGQQLEITFDSIGDALTTANTGSGGGTGAGTGTPTTP